METYFIPKGTHLERVEVSPDRQYDNPKFYSFIRNKTMCPKNPWIDRCINYCRIMELEVITNLNLLIVPYKAILMDEADEYDRTLARKLMVMAEDIYQDDQPALISAQTAISELINQTYDLPHKNISNDWVLATLICKIGLDGWIRTTLGDPRISDTDCFDEVMICNPDQKVKVIFEK